ILMYLERVAHSAPDPYLQIGPKKKIKDSRPFSQKFAEILKYSPTRRPRTPGGGFLQSRKKLSPFPHYEQRTKSVLSSPAIQAAQRVKVQESRSRAHSVPRFREQRHRFRIN